MKQHYDIFSLEPENGWKREYTASTKDGAVMIAESTASGYIKAAERFISTMGIKWVIVVNRETGDFELMLKNGVPASPVNLAPIDPA